MGGGAPLVQYTSAKTNVVFDGNSLVSGVGSTGGQNIAVQLAAMSPISGNLTITNLGIGGQTTGQMISTVSDVHAAYVSGKINVLIAWEGTNSMFSGGRTAVQAYTDMTTYCSTVLAQHPWFIVLMTTLPRHEGETLPQSTVDAQNLKLTDYNTLLKDNFRTMGAKAIVDVRGVGSPFEFSDYTLATFHSATVEQYWADDGNRQIHCNNLGYGWIAQNRVAPVLRRLTRI